MYSILDNISNEIIINNSRFITLIYKVYNIKDIDKLALSCGPGSFTGIRVAMSVIKTLAQTLNKSVVSVDTLEILKYQLNIFII